MRGLLLALAAGVVLAGCKRHDRFADARHVTQAEDPRDQAPRVQPGPAPPEPEAFRARALPVRNPYEGDAKAIQEGRRLYRWMNCNGCHAEGGGSIGPPLWDDQWRYGGRGIDIAESILHGRPDGMPRFAGHLPEDQVWKIVAYVQSLEPRGGPYHAGVK
ncbi:MAG TPA: c-type cytochrome [Longimicrobiaceae bacterium]|nr:c-type cytochrome [Longimicrobiaceae bacterium]